MTDILCFKLKLYLCSGKRNINKQTNKQMVIRYEILPIFLKDFRPYDFNDGFTERLSLVGRFLKKNIAKYICKVACFELLNATAIRMHY